MDDQVVFVDSLANVVVDYLSVLDPQHHVAHVSSSLMKQSMGTTLRQQASLVSVPHVL